MDQILDERREQGLKKVRDAFPDSQISKLPKPTKNQTEEVRANPRAGIRCEVCGGFHHPKVVHLDYVGHAAITNRLLDADPLWSWEPFANDTNGLPALDRDGGLWIRLTVCGHTRIGYGDAQGKTGGDAMKERIGDALRNAAMRFGAALDLWSKADLHAEDKEEAEPQTSYAEGVFKSMRDAESSEAAKKIGRAAYKNLTPEEQKTATEIIAEKEANK